MTGYGTEWCRAQAMRLLEFHAPALNPAGGFYKLATDGTPLPDTTRELHETTRMIHAYAQGAQLGFAGAERIMDHGIRFLFEGHLDLVPGRFWWSVDDAVRQSPQAGLWSRFRFMAAASAAQSDHPDASRLRETVMTVLRGQFWEDRPVSDMFEGDWTGAPDYRGNANMHHRGAHRSYQAWGDTADLEMARSIPAT